MKSWKFYLSKKTITCAGILGLVGTILYANWIEGCQHNKKAYEVSSSKPNHNASNWQVKGSFDKPQFNDDLAFKNESLTYKRDPLANNHLSKTDKYHYHAEQIDPFHYSSQYTYQPLSSYAYQEERMEHQLSYYPQYEQQSLHPYVSQQQNGVQSNAQNPYYYSLDDQPELASSSTIQPTTSQSFIASTTNWMAQPFSKMSQLINFDCLKTVRIEAGGVFGDFIGLHTNYAEVGLFIAPGAVSRWQSFLDLRDYRFKGGCWGASAGLGIRRWSDCCNQLFGANIYYDYRETLFQQELCNCPCDVKKWRYNSFNRIGLGLEYLGGWLDWRINGYIPVGSIRHRGQSTYYNFDGGYQAHLQPAQFIRYGVDGEVGREIFCWNGARVYSAVGGYYYSNRYLRSVAGTQARLELNWSKYLSMELRYSYDHTYRSRFQGRFLFSIPLENLCGWMDACERCLDVFLLQPVKRFNVPFIDSQYCWKWNW